jgi:hypothetical protein
MNGGTCGIGHPSRAWRLTARVVAAVTATAVLVLPAAAYGGGFTVAGGSSHTRAPELSHSANTQKALAYSRCMRSHGVSNFPDPNSRGLLPKVSQQQLDNPRFQAAQRACQDLLPAGTNDQFPPGEVQQLLIGMLRFSKCMRSHGVPKWPDPATDSQGRPMFPLSTAGFSRQQARSSLVTRAASACQHLMPPALGGIPIG